MVDQRKELKSSGLNEASFRLYGPVLHLLQTRRLQEWLPLLRRLMAVAEDLLSSAGDLNLGICLTSGQVDAQMVPPGCNSPDRSHVASSRNKKTLSLLSENEWKHRG